MWQRIQTLYLLVATALISSMFFSCKAGDIRFISYIPYLILLVVITLLHLIALSACKFRIFQLRTAVLSALVCLALQAWLTVDFIVCGNNPVFRLPSVFPIVAAILDALAAGNIWSDELLVRSASRLRSAKRNRKAK